MILKPTICPFTCVLSGFFCYSAGHFNQSLNQFQSPPLYINYYCGHERPNQMVFLWCVEAIMTGFCLNAAQSWIDWVKDMLLSAPFMFCLKPPEAWRRWNSQALSFSSFSAFLLSLIHFLLSLSGSHPSMFFFCCDVGYCMTVINKSFGRFDLYCKVF